MNSVVVMPYWVDTASLEHLAEDGIHLILEEDVSRLHEHLSASILAVVVNADGHLADTPILCRQVRQQIQNILLFAVTAHYADARLAAIQAGADELLTAPLDWVELRWRLKKLQSQFNPYTQWNGISNILIHDLKSPLGTALSSLEVLREVVEGEQERVLIDNSLRAIRRQAELLDDGLDYLLIRSHNYVPEAQAIRLNTVLEFVKQHLKPMLDLKEMDFVYQIPEDFPPIHADYGLLTRVLKALIDNASKFCLRNSIIRLEAWGEDSQAVLHLSDNGRAILPAYENHLFTLSHQWEARVEGSRSTVALNLPFVKAALNLMGGDVTASTTAGTTTFKLTLPLA